MHKKVNVRRNTQWIEWDMGYPLFILGLPYDPDISRLRIFLYIFKAFLGLAKPKRMKSNYLIISLHAKSETTLQYWDKIQGVDQLIKLPLNQERSKIPIKSLEKMSKNYQVLDLINSRKSCKSIDSSLFTNKLQQKLVVFLCLINKQYLKKQGFRFSASDLVDAVAKIDWDSYFVQRIQSNLMKEPNGKKTR
jgi:hypothetical protein